jgi:hypothetical protein
MNTIIKSMQYYKCLLRLSLLKTPNGRLNRANLSLDEAHEPCRTPCGHRHALPHSCEELEPRQIRQRLLDLSGCSFVGRSSSKSCVLVCSALGGVALPC